MVRRASRCNSSDFTPRHRGPLATGAPYEVARREHVLWWPPTMLVAMKSLNLFSCLRNSIDAPVASARQPLGDVSFQLCTDHRFSATCEFAFGSAGLRARVFPWTFVQSIEA